MCGKKPGWDTGDQSRWGQEDNLDAKSYVVQMRLKSGLSQTEFAAALGVSKRTLEQRKQGRRKPSGSSVNGVRLCFLDYPRKITNDPSPRLNTRLAILRPILACPHTTTEFGFLHVTHRHTPLGLTLTVSCGIHWCE